MQRIYFTMYLYIAYLKIFHKSFRTSQYTTYMQVLYSYKISNVNHEHLKHPVI